MAIKGLRLTFILIFISSLAIMSTPVESQSTSNIIIDSDGSVTGTTAIAQSDNTYTLTANITENIQLQKSNIVIDGAGYAINNAEIDLTNGVGHSFSNQPIYNITIRNLIIIGGEVSTNGGGNHTFYNNYITRLNLVNSEYNNITHCTVGSIDMSYGGSFTTITENNIINGVTAFLASNVTVDRNYWRFYLRDYPNATEIGNTGIGNQPYVIKTSTPVIGPDYHPLMKPISIPLTGTNIEFPTPTPTPDETDEPIGTPIPPRTPNPTPYTPESQLLPLVAVLALIIALSAIAVLIARRRKT